ncbi:MAG TPA: hypothetical protein VH880_04935 [Anaeromyxobacteraceae bacterium]|jgi:hypothetical protein
MTTTAALLALALSQPWGYPPSRPPPPPMPRGLVGVVFMPLGSATTTSADGLYDDYPVMQGALALEFRGMRGGGRIRFGTEVSRYDRIFDVSLKYNFNDWGLVQPFLTVGLGGARLDPETIWRGTLSASVGIDVFLSPDLFLTGELKGRAFADPPADYAYVYATGVAQTAVLFGVGVFF